MKNMSHNILNAFLPECYVIKVGMTDFQCLRKRLKSSKWFEIEESWGKIGLMDYAVPVL